MGISSFSSLNVILINQNFESNNFDIDFLSLLQDTNASREKITVLCSEIQRNHMQVAQEIN